MALQLHVEILKSLRACPPIVRALVGGLTDDEVRRRPGPGEWAVIEVLAHMADTDATAMARLRRIIAEDQPDLDAFDQQALAERRGYLGFDLQFTLDRYQAGRRRHLNVLEGLTTVQWQRTGRHTEHGEMSIELYEAHVAGEDVDHLGQIARMVAPTPLR